MANPFSIFFPKRKPRRRDFSTGDNSANPLFQSSQPSRVPWLAILILVIIISGAAYAIATPNLRISNIEVSGTDKLDSASVVNFTNEWLNTTYLGVAWRRVFFLLPERQLELAIRDAAGRLVPVGNVTIERSGRTGVKVTITESAPDALWQRRTGERYFLDQAGAIVEQAPDSLIEELPTIIDSNNLPVSLNTTVTNQQLLEAVRETRQRLPELGLTIKSVSTWKIRCLLSDVPTNSSTNTNSSSADEAPADPVPVDCDEQALAVIERSFVVETNEGWELRLTAATPIDQQLNKLATTLRERLKAPRTNLQYVDVRFGDRVYFR